jgi:hypothetical protein
MEVARSVLSGREKSRDLVHSGCVERVRSFGSRMIAASDQLKTYSTTL